MAAIHLSHTKRELNGVEPLYATIPLVMRSKGVSMSQACFKLQIA